MKTTLGLGFSSNGGPKPPVKILIIGQSIANLAFEDTSFSDPGGFGPPFDEKPNPNVVFM